MEDTIRAVLVGCGGISRAWLRAAPNIRGLEIVGLVDIVPQAAQDCAVQFGLDRVDIDTDLPAMLERTHPDVVFNCTIPQAHRAVTLTALESGCHVLSEKPLADSMAAARELVQAAQQAGWLFAVIQNRRYDPNIRRLSRFLRSGAIGRITTVDNDFYLGAHFGGFRDHMPHVLLLDMAIHTFDAARLISGVDPLAVYCKEWNPPGSWYDHDASAIAIFDMQDEVVYTYRGSWCSEGVNTTWESTWRVIGTEGTVTWDGATGFKAQAVAQRGSFISQLRDIEIPPLDPQDRTGGHGGQIADFIDCVRTGRIPETTGADNIKSLAMVFGAIESAAQRRPLPID